MEQATQPVIVTVARFEVATNGRIETTNEYAEWETLFSALLIVRGN